MKARGHETNRRVGWYGVSRLALFQALGKVPGLEVNVASRRGPLQVDVTRPETFDALVGADLVIDLTDATTTRPDDVVSWCLDRGITVIEATSDAPCVERLGRQHEQRTLGALVLGGGIFTGVSNLLARHVASQTPEAKSVTLGVATTPFSGAGVGTIALMVHALGVAAVRFIDGVRHDLVGIEAGPALDFGSGPRETLRTSLAEPYMIHRSLGVPSVDVLLAPKPRVLATMFRLTPALFFTSALGQRLMTLYFTFLRRVLFRSVPTSVEMVGSASNGRVTVSQLVVARDGMMAGAWALAAMTEAIAAARPARGVWLIDQLVGLEPIIARANQLAQSPAFELQPARKNEP